MGGWSLVSLCSKDPSGTTSLCWVRDKADCYFDLVTFSLPLKVSPEFLLGVQTARVGGGGSWNDPAPSPHACLLLLFLVILPVSPGATTSIFALDIKEKYCTLASAREVIMRI